MTVRTAFIGRNKEREHHIILVYEPQIWDVKGDVVFAEFLESLGPGRFFRVQLQIQHALWSGDMIAHKGHTLRYRGRYIPCQEALPSFWRTHEQEIRRTRDQALNKPLQMRAGDGEILKRADGSYFIRHAGKSLPRDAGEETCHTCGGEKPAWFYGYVQDPARLGYFNLVWWCEECAALQVLGGEK